MWFYLDVLRLVPSMPGERFAFTSHFIASPTPAECREAKRVLISQMRTLLRGRRAYTIEFHETRI